MPPFPLGPAEGGGDALVVFFTSIALWAFYFLPLLPPPLPTNRPQERGGELWPSASALCLYVLRDRASLDPAGPWASQMRLSVASIGSGARGAGTYEALRTELPLLRALKT